MITFLLTLISQENPVFLEKKTDIHVVHTSHFCSSLSY